MFLDGIEQGSLIFSATGFVSSPRVAYGIRSDLLFDILQRLSDAELRIQQPAQVMITGNAPVAPTTADSAVTGAAGPNERAGDANTIASSRIVGGEKRDGGEIPGR